MSTQDKIAVFRRLVDEVISGDNLAAFDEVISPDFVEHERPPGVPQGREGTRQLFSMLHEAFPGLRAEIEDIVADDDKVVFRMTWRGTHTGAFIGIPPTGKPIEIGVFDLVRVADGKLVEHWGLLDQLTLLQQLGVVPTPDQATA